MKEFNPNFDYVQIDPQVMAKTMGGTDSLMEDYDQVYNPTKPGSSDEYGTRLLNSMSHMYEKAEVPNDELSIDELYGWGDGKETQSGTNQSLKNADNSFVDASSILKEILKELKEIKIIVAGK